MFVEKTNTGFSAYSDDYPIFTTGKTMNGLMKNAQEASDLYFNDDENKYTITIKLVVDLKQFFSYYKVINARYLAERIGMNPTLLSQYVIGKKKPSVIQTEKIISGIHQIGRELSELNFIRK